MPFARFLKSDAGFGGAVFAAGFLLCWLPLALLPPTLPIPDELYQFLEAGHRIAFGYGMVPWEFDYGARSWVLGYVAALPMALAGLLGQGPYVYLPLTWGAFALGEGAMILCAGLWGARLYGRMGGLAVALVAASWIDNLYFGGRALSEIVTGHLLVAAIWLAEPGYDVEDRRRLALAGFLAALAVLLRLQLAPAALLLWLWRWRDVRRLLPLSAGAVAALVLDGAFDAATWGIPFLPLWQNFKFNILLDGAAQIFGSQEPWQYFEDFWTHWGLALLPFLGLAALGARRLPLLGWTAMVILIVHIAIGHKEYRFIQPAVMMASILCGLGIVEAIRLLSGWLGEKARCWAAPAMTLFWLAACGGNIAALANAPAWNEGSSLPEVSLALSRMPVCGVGLANIAAWQDGGYTFLHQRVPLYLGSGSREQFEDFFASQKKYNVVVMKREDESTFASMPEFENYALVRCFEEYCILKREGGCVGPPPKRPRIAPLAITVARDSYYPYAVGVP